MLPECQLPSYDVRTEWLRGGGAASEVVMSSRVRLARNLAGLPFPGRASRLDRQSVLDVCRARVTASNLGERTVWIDLHGAPALERQLLVERHLISKQHARARGPSGTDKPADSQSDPRAVAVGVPGERVSVMVNEEDHLRIQVVRAGLGLSEAWAEIDALDDSLEAGIDYAFSERFGYLTACPTNVGTGVRMSVMLHLPALRMTGDIEKVKKAATDMHLAVRGFYGEGSEAAGDYYQISNQTTLGKTETVILHELEKEILPQVIEYERSARRTLRSKRGPALKDQVFRAWGILTNARLLTTEEAMQLLSHVRLGALLGLLPNVDPAAVGHLTLLVQPAHLQRVLNLELDQEQRRAARSDLVRSRIGTA